MKKVLIPTKLDKIAASTLLANGGYEVIQDADTTLDNLAAANSDAHAIIVRSEKVTPAIIDALPNLKVIVRAGAGYDNIDTAYARSRGIDVMNTPGANSNGVAEEVIALVLADMRHIVPADISTRAGKWEKKKFMGNELTGKTVGIVGLGHIGRLVAKRLTGFECKLLGYDPWLSAECAAAAGIELVALEELLAKSDIVTLHIPENDATRGMFGEKLLGLMKPKARLVNCARAGIIDEAGLRKVKAEKELRYLNDVYPKDCEGEKSIADVADIMLPHLGASTHEANFVAALRSAEELIELDTTGDASAIVNRAK